MCSKESNIIGLISVCVLGYVGVFCHINADECVSQPCLNNGKCVDKINSFHCECPKGENGKNNEVNEVKVFGSP